MCILLHLPVILCEDDRPRVGFAVPVVLHRDRAEDDLTGVVLLEGGAVRRRVQVLVRVVQVVARPPPGEGEGRKEGE